MSFDKVKVLRAAEKYLTQGRIAPAITEYCKIVAEEPGDFTALNMLGDLYERTGKSVEAIKCFSGIATHYREQGFNLKAIAMFKKIYRLQPENPEVAYQLGHLYETQGLAVDARSQYMVVAEHHQRAGDMRKTLEMLHRVADLDPHNVETRLKLAEGYLRESMQDEAAAAFTEAGGQMLARKNYERALVAFDRALTLAPAKYEVWSGLVEAHTALNSPNEAAELLRRHGALEKNDPELLALLTQAYLADENAAAAEQSAQQLLRCEPASYTRLLDVARLHLKHNHLDDCVRLLEGIVEAILNARAEAALVYVLNEVAARNPEHLPALKLLVRIHQWCHDEENLQKVLERILEVAETLQMPDEERATLKQLSALVPHHEGYRQRLRDLGDPEETTPTLARAVMPESETAFYDSLAGLASAVATTEETIGFDIIAPTDAQYDTLTNMSDKPEPVANAWPAAAAISFADLNEETPDFAAPDAPPTPLEPSFGGLDEHHYRLLQQELESVDFYIAQGYQDIAQDTLEMLERQFGAHPDITTRLAILAPPQEAAPAEPAPQWMAETPALAIPLEAAPPQPEALFFTESIALDSFAHDAVEEDIAFVDAVPTTPLQFVVETTLAVPQAIAPVSFNGFQEPAPRVPAPAPARPRQPVLHPGLAEVFDEFRVAVEEETQLPSDDDFETHYNLGLAYQEMELANEAIEEFQIAAKLVSPTDGTPRYLHCCNLLGHCFMSKGLPRVAARWFKKGMETQDISEDSYLAMLYDLGLAYETMGDNEKAVDAFMEVYGVNVAYREVSEKLHELQQLQAA